MTCEADLKVRLYGSDLYVKGKLRVSVPPWLVISEGCFPSRGRG